jgi:hypothetical protein
MEICLGIFWVGPGQEKARLKILRPRLGPARLSGCIFQPRPDPSGQKSLSRAFSKSSFSNLGLAHYCYQTTNSSLGLARLHVLAQRARLFLGQAAHAQAWMEGLWIRVTEN